MYTTLLVIGIAVCALQTIRAETLPLSALWLAGASAFTALAIYSLGAFEVAVIELSVGAGLVTILLVYSINLAGQGSSRTKSLVPYWLVALLVIPIVVILMVSGLTIAPRTVSRDTAAFATTVWSDRQLDGILQTVLIVTGTLTVLGLLSHEHSDRPAIPSTDLATHPSPESDQEIRPSPGPSL